MNNLTVFQHDSIDVVDSRQVAEMIGKQHKHLLRDIQNYCDVIQKNGLLKNEESAGQPKFGPSDFFIPSTYINSQNKEQPCYLLTKKGCDMVANKMTGEKGVLFTAAYVTAFEAMRHHIEGEPKQIGDKPMTAYQQMMAEKWERDHALQEARFYAGMAKRYRGSTYEQVLNAYATKSLSGEFLLPLPESGEKLLSAGEVGQELGISANLVGKLAKQHGLKTDQYGMWVHDKSPYSAKEVTCFRYKACAVDRLREILAQL